MNRKTKYCICMLVFIMLFIFLTSKVGASDDGQDSFDYLTGNATVNVSGLSLRTGPGTEFNAITSINKSQAVKLVGKIGDWYAVFDYSSNQIGFVSGEYITIVSDDSKNDPKVPDEEAPNLSEDVVMPENISDDEQRLFALTNNVRQERGAGRLEYNEELSKVAYEKARDMVINNYFSHQSPSYGSPFEMMKAYGVNFTSAAENIAGNQTVDGAFYAWMNSDSHMKNITNGDFTSTGIGVYTSPIYGKIIVQLFIR
ncbi:MAG: SCP-like extracellular protein [Ruminococcaceae bacterium]|nr:SCP-like extracellular protein [Oscillospiraceae bacterium]